MGLLAQTFLARESVRLGRESPRINPGALHRLARYAWPGNVRELENVVQRLLVLEEGDSITAETLARDPELLLGGSSGRDTETVPSEQADARRRILEALERTGGHREQAAALLGMSRSTLYRRIRALGLRP